MACRKRQERERELLFRQTYSITLSSVRGCRESDVETDGGSHDVQWIVQRKEFAYKANHSTVKALFDMMETWRSNTNVFLDMSAAFDCVDQAVFSV